MKMGHRVRLPSLPPICKENYMDDLVYRLQKRAEIRRQIQSRKSVQEGKPDRISDLLEEAANRIKELEDKLDGNVT